MRVLSVVSVGLVVASGWSQVNVAAAANGGVAGQSSTYTHGVAGRANDGDRNGVWANGSVNHTEFELNAWWEATFDSDYFIREVLVFNRTDNNGQLRLNPFRVELYDSLGAVVWSQTGITHTPDIVEPDVEGMAFATGDVLARRVRVQLDGHQNWLHLAEVEAINAVPEPGTMLALGAGLVAILRKRRS